MRHVNRNRIAVLLSAVVCAACAPTPEELAAEHQQTLERYCVDCHNAAEAEAGLSLEGLDPGTAGEHPDIFEEVVVKLRGGLMPPPGNPRPDEEVATAMVAYLEDTLDAAQADDPWVGRASIHRLNRTEYGNAVRDLLALEIDPREFLPADDEGYGFDNIADILRVSPSLLEQYLSASSVIAALAVGDPDSPQVSRVFRAPPDLAQGQHQAGMPLGTRGGIVIEHEFPLDATYEFSVFLRRNIVGYMTGLEWPHELEIAIDGERVFLAPVGGEEDNAMSDANFSAAADTIDERLRTSVFVPAGPHTVTIGFLRRNSALTHEPLELHTRDLDLQNMNGLPVVDYVNLRGPIDAVGSGATPSRARIFTCVPQNAAEKELCAEDIIGSLARRAYRRPVDETDLGLLMDAYRRADEREGFEAGIQNAVRVILASPAFLFRDEPDPSEHAPGVKYPLDDLSLASRLSFFLWSSIPDAELLEVAEQGRLSDPAEFDRQLSRMLADAKADAIVENFAGQWLFLRNLQSARPDINTFPDYDENLRRAMRIETEMLFSDILRNDKSVVELIAADYTYVNERLAEHYGISDIKGSHFRRVPVPDENRRGLLGHGSILTVTSYPNRTSPVLRGKWIMENVLGTPAPAPPPNVPALEENEGGRPARSMRERLADHRANPVCASCHDIMDPLGLGLESFDGIGRWREKEPGGVIDASGQMVDGTPFEGPAELRELLLQHPERFVTVVAEKLLIYALGRGLDPEDMPTVRAIVREAAEEDYRFSALVRGVANAPQFRLRMAAE
jgi:mono/diheme cytochrome c family protein